VLTKTRTKKQSYSVGIFANTEEYGLQLVPLLGLYYLSTDNRFEANFLLPIRAELSYGLGANTRLGMRFDGLGTSYAVNSPPYPNTYVNKSSNELFAYLQYALGPSLLLRFNTGYAFFRAYKTYDTDDKIAFSIASIYFGDNRTILNSGLQDGLLFKFEAVYRFHFKENNRK
jgi:hypothetical protein